MTTPTPIFFNQLLISMNLYEDTKNQAFSWLCSRVKVHFRTLQSDWPIPFWPISQKPDFSQIWDGLSNHSAINIYFRNRPNSEKKKK